MNWLWRVMATCLLLRIMFFFFFGLSVYLKEWVFTDKALSEEVDKLKELIQEGHHHHYEDQSGRRRERKTPESAQVTRRSMRKRSRQSGDVVETDIVSPQISIHHKEPVKQIAFHPLCSELCVAHLPSQTQWMIKFFLLILFLAFCFKETLVVSQPQCCKTTYGGTSSSASCTFQALGEHLLGMKLSTNKEGEQVCIIASHPTSGNYFCIKLCLCMFLRVVFNQHIHFRLLLWFKRWTIQWFWDHQPPEKNGCWSFLPDLFDHNRIIIQPKSSK